MTRKYSWIIETIVWYFCVSHEKAYEIEKHLSMDELNRIINLYEEKVLK